jgi:uncharacterized membrane protein SpoIIM required for sporulation
MKNILSFLWISIACWLFAFIIRIFFVESSKINADQITIPPLTENHNIVTKIIDLIIEDNKYEAFVLIFENNIKGCILNITGGIFLGLGTFFNLMYNGFFMSDIFMSSYKAGLSIDFMLKITSPHSFELVGFWLSGAIGFYIAWNIIQFMRGKESFTVRFYKYVGIYSLVVFFIILAAAYVEAYISTSFISQ